MRYLLIILILSVTFSLAITPTKVIHACSCVESGPALLNLLNSDAVFSGRVVNINFPTTGPTVTSADPEYVTFLIYRSYWGLQGSNTITVRTPNGGASCGFDFEKDKEYLVYAWKYKEQFAASFCSKTSLLSEARSDIRLFNGIYLFVGGGSLGMLTFILYRLLYKSTH